MRSGWLRQMPQLAAAQSQLALANVQLSRAQTLKRTDYGTAESVDQRTSDQQSAQAAIDAAKAQIRDAQFDVDHSRIVAPFTGRIGEHQVSVGSLVAGSRSASSPTTLLATLVSLDPIHLDFDMSESDFLTFSRQRAASPGALADKVDIGLSDETNFKRQGTLEFRRQRARPVQRHHPCPGAGVQPGPVLDAGPVRAASPRGRAGRADGPGARCGGPARAASRSTSC